MTYTIDTLVADVMARLGEVAAPRLPEGGDIETGEEAPHPPDGGDIPWPEDIIGLKVKSLLSDVGSGLIGEAEAHLLNSPPLGGWGAGRSILMPCGLYAAEVRLPDGFLRFVSVKMSGWGRSVSSLVMPDAPEWGRQWSAEPGIAGCPERPKAYFDRDGGGLLLRLVGSETSEATIEWLALWTIPTLSEAGEFDFPVLLYPSLVGAIVDILSR